MKHIFLFSSLLISIFAFGQFPSKGHNITNPTFLDSTLSDYDLFFTPEVHWNSKNSNRKRRMIEYLAGKNSIDVMVVERSYDFGHWVNYFLETGDSLFLKEYLSYASFFSTYEGVVYDDEYQFYLWLRQFSKNNNRVIKVIGIDMAPFWHGKPILWSFLKLTEQNSELQKPLGMSIAEAKNLLKEENIGIKDILKWYHKLESFSNEMNVTDQAFSNYLYNLKQSVKWSKGRDVDYREGEIAKNFMKYTKEGQKVYGQYGMGHITLTPENLLRSKPFQAFAPKVFVSFVSMLNKEKAYQNKILSIGLVCFDCDEFDDYPGPDLFYPFLKQEEFDRLMQELLVLPSGTIIDFRQSKETIKNYCQLLLVEHD